MGCRIQCRNRADEAVTPADTRASGPASLPLFGSSPKENLLSQTFNCKLLLRAHTLHPTCHIDLPA